MLRRCIGVVGDERLVGLDSKSRGDGPITRSRIATYLGLGCFKGGGLEDREDERSDREDDHDQPPASIRRRIERFARRLRSSLHALASRMSPWVFTDPTLRYAMWASSRSLLRSRLASLWMPAAGAGARPRPRNVPYCSLSHSSSLLQN